MSNFQIIFFQLIFRHFEALVLSYDFFSFESILYTMEHMWRSGDNFTQAVLFFHYVGPRRQSQVSGLMVGTFIH